MSREGGGEWAVIPRPIDRHLAILGRSMRDGQMYLAILGRSMRDGQMYNVSKLGQPRYGAQKTVADDARRGYAGMG